MNPRLYHNGGWKTWKVGHFAHPGTSVLAFDESSGLSSFELDQAVKPKAVRKKSDDVVLPRNFELMVVRDELNDQWVVQALTGGGSECVASTQLPETLDQLVSWAQLVYTLNAGELREP